MGEIHELFVLALFLVWFGLPGRLLDQDVSQGPLVGAAPIRLSISGVKSGTDLETPRKRSQSKFWISRFRAVGDPKALENTGNSLPRFISELCYPQYGWYPFLFWKGPLHGTARAGHEIPNSTGGTSKFFQEPKEEPEPPEPFCRNQSRNRNHAFLLKLYWSSEKPFPQRNRRNRKPEALEPFDTRTATELNQIVAKAWNS